MPRLDLRRLADVHDTSSFSSRMRQRRFAAFEAILVGLPNTSPTRILDIGGTVDFWHGRGYADRGDVRITTVNHTPEAQQFENIIPVVADATELSGFDDDSFDVAFSNSTIEHLFTLQAQAAMATEVRRLAPVYYVQTPNFWFPVEPHFLFPGWQWLPRTVRATVLHRRRMGHRGPYPSSVAAMTAVEEIRLLTVAEMRALFPDGEIVRERIGPFTKSLVAVRT